MQRESEEKEFRLFVRGSPSFRQQNEPAACSAALKAVIHYAGTSRSRKRRGRFWVETPTDPDARGISDARFE